MKKKMFLKEVTYGHQVCIYSIKNSLLWNIITI